MKYFWFILLSFVTLTLTAQNSARVKSLERQRKQTLSEIEKTSKQLNATKRTEKNMLNRLNLISQQIDSRHKVISLLNQEVTELDRQISITQQTISELEDQLKEKQANYAKSVKNLYRRHGSIDKLLFVLSADNFSQSIRRMRYLREYAAWQKRQAEDIITTQQQIEHHKQYLENNRHSKHTLIGTREIENKHLEVEKQNKQVEVQQLNSKQKELQAVLRKKQQQAEDLNRQIEQQIAMEIARAEAEAQAARERLARIEKAKSEALAKRLSNKKKSGKKNEEETEPAPTPEPVREERVADTKGGYAMTRAEKALADNFAENKGRLPYPVTGNHTITSGFGEQQHQELQYVHTYNSGIDIKTNPGANARAVFNGEVTRIFVVPGYNNSIIVRHGNYLSVYSNLSRVYVKAGDRVSTRQALGQIYSDSEDNNSTVLHFQIWKERTKLNPSAWLE